jgi:hypothetical protein
MTNLVEWLLYVHQHLAGERMKACCDHLSNYAGLQEGDRVWLYHLTRTRGRLLQDDHPDQWRLLQDPVACWGGDGGGWYCIWGLFSWGSVVGTEQGRITLPGLCMPLNQSGMFAKLIGEWERPRSHVNVLGSYRQVLCLHEGRKQQREWSVF